MPEQRDAAGPFVPEHWAARWARQLSLGAVLAIGAGGVTAAGLVDYFVATNAGNDIGVTGLYVLPVALAAGAAGRKAGWLIAGFAAAVETGVTWAAARGGGHLAILGSGVFLELLVFLAAAELASLLRAHLEREQQMSRTDTVTGIANGRSFFEAAAVELERSRRHGTPLSVVYFDIDDFKDVNDSRGHDAGDDLLRVVGSCLRESVRKPDVAARIGGDEFVLLLSESGPDATRSAVDRVRLQLREAMRASGFTNTASIGAFTLLSGATTVEDLVAAADAAMYNVKHGGKDDVRYEVIAGPPDATRRRNLAPGTATTLQTEGGLALARKPGPRSDRPRDSASALNGSAWAGRVLRFWQSRTPPSLRPMVRYLSAPVAVFFAALIQYVLLPEPSIAPFVFFYFSVALVAWLAGNGPGLTTVLLSAAVANWLFLEPYRQFSLSGPALAATFLFAVGAGAVAVLCAAFRDALIEAQRTATQLRLQAALLRHSFDNTRESEARFRTLADNLSQLAWMADRKGDVFWFNERWYQYTGASFDEARSGGFLHPDHVERVTARHRRAVEVGEPWEDVFPLRGRDGTYRWFLSRAVPIRDEKGEVTRWLGTNTDVTEQRHAEQALRNSEAQLRVANDLLKAADQRKNEFIGVLSHELRNPLSSIGVSIHVARRTAAGREQKRRVLGVIDRQVQQLTRLVDDLLDVTRIGRGKVRLRREAVDLRALVRHAAEDSRSLFEKHGIELELRVPDEPLVVDGDPTRLAQIISNLLHNAVKFSPRGTRTALWVRRADEHDAEIVVKDGGIGIAPDVLPKLFEPFVQGAPTLEHGPGGLGIGLALVKGLVGMHGGTVSVDSAGPGHGASFVVRLPVERKKAPRRAMGAGPTARSPVRRILVIDDNIAAADGLKEALELNEHTVDVAYTGSEGVLKARGFQPDVVLCDIGLHDMTGFDVAKAMRADPNLRTAALIALSGYVLPEDVERAKQAGFHLHLAKPPDFTALEQAIAEARAKAG
jgi:diguanylate cyclase (GGDEF)-like protein/PAS domain S-box-containing protein